MLLIDKYAYINRLNKIHPAEKMVLTFFLLMFSLAVQDIVVSISIFIVMSSLTIFAAKIPFRYYVKLLLLPVFFLVSSTLTILFSFAQGDIPYSALLWRIEIGNWQIFISESNAEKVISLIFVVLCSISCLYFLILTTPVQAIFQVLRKLKVPALLMELIEITYRFIFVFIESALRIYLAQQSRLGYHSIKQTFHSLASLISAIFAAVFQRARELTVAMDSRGYEGEILFLDEYYQYSLKSWGIITGIIFLIIIVYILFGGLL
ncbi:cobalt ECF transporter T component CbiQ [Bacillus benzoevorans]|uniref:Cobalt/nickel transport system permease protein n=1 Tax=Bacillus benzoevorans TaxID=1456 RepID=A0A7X0HQT7_9BACI|nr:cobalt ECF transporter T component CbiQ [Bacillus benzoevorans]MBB6443930.1 cobalt/nickel transport system permease protein [Bacillus benzoevorans]